MLDLLKSYFGYDQFRPGQAEIISHVLSGRDALVLMPTGGGKSLCYQLPALKLPGLTLVISPLIALMKDQVDGLRSNGISAAFLNSSLSEQESGRVIADLRAGNIKLLYLAPERLAMPSFQLLLRSLMLSLIAVDEAHCISEWGHDFRPEYRGLSSLRDVFPEIPIVALTATANDRVRKDIIMQLRLKNGRVYCTSFNRPNLTYRVLSKKNSFEALLSLIDRYPQQPIIIYAFSRKDTESIASDLGLQGIRALPYHAGLDQTIRATTQEKFIRDEIPVIVATIAFGMGVNKPDVRLVVHMDMPKSVEGYYQETGRAGRDGLPSECVLFYSSGDRRKQDYFIDQLTDHIERDRARQQLKYMMDYCEHVHCRRKYLLSYFGETIVQETCGNCDRCLAPIGEVRDVTDDARLVIQAVQKTGQFYGLDYIVDVLRGAKRQKILERKHHTLPLYGTARTLSADHLKSVAQALCAKGLLIKAGDRYPVLTVTDIGCRFLETNERFTMTSVPADIIHTDRSTRQLTPTFDVVLFDRLRLLRKQVADEAGVPPYIVFGDKTLQEMSRSFPQSEQNLLRISGVGHEKLRRFGKKFLAEISTYATAHGIKEAMSQVITTAPTRTVRNSDTLAETRLLLGEKLSLDQMATRRQLSPSTIVNHLERLFDTDKNIDVMHLEPTADRFQEMCRAFKQTGGFALTPVRTLLGDRYSYEELRLVRLLMKRGKR